MNIITGKGLSTLLIMFAALAATSGAVTNADEVGFYHEVRADNTVQFRWRPDVWKTDQIGFRLERRDDQAPADQDAGPAWGEWSTVGPDVIEPDLTERRLERDNLEKVLEAHREGFDSDKLSPADIIEVFTTQPEEFKKVKWLCSKHQDWNVAFALGWHDQWAPERRGRRAQYRLRRVLRVGGQIKLEEAADTVVLFDPDAWPAPEVTSFEVYRPGKKQDNATAVWQVPEQAYDQHPNIPGFVLLQGEVDGSLDNNLGFFPRAIWGDVEDGIRTVKYSAGRPGDGRYKYGLAPKNMFGMIGPVVHYAILDSKPAKLLPPHAPRFEQTAEGVMLRWAHKQPRGTRFAGYRVMRKLPGGNEFVAVNDKLLSPLVREYVDTGLSGVGEGQVIEYRIDIVTGDRRPGKTGGVGKHRVPLGKPGTPADFTATFKQIEGQWHLVCGWKAAKSTGVTHYNVERFLPESELWDGSYSTRQASGDTFRALGVQPSTQWKLRVRAVNKDGKMGPPSNSVIAETPLYVSSFAPRKLWAHHKDGKVQFRWFSPEHGEVVGYRLLADGKVLVKEDKIKSLARDYEVSDVPPGEVTVGVVAVLADGRATDPVTTKVKVPMSQAQAEAAEEKALAESGIVRTFEKVRHFGNEPKVIGSKTQAAELTNGKTVRHGASIRYYQDPPGQKMIETHYVRGERHGLRRAWRKDGELSSLKAYVDGKQLDQSEIPQSQFADQLTAADRAWLEQNAE